jgi:hypothetical protein
MQQRCATELCASLLNFRTAATRVMAQSQFFAASYQYVYQKVALQEPINASLLRDRFVRSRKHSHS